HSANINRKQQKTVNKINKTKQIINKDIIQLKEIDHAKINRISNATLTKQYKEDNKRKII
ncbi:MAG: hypothetical protein MJA29_07980, partial [Candidatus Omnitrophica bacterium]|nr:hypothetical protein [Candidatus Omnitrophota bacterium]